MNTREKIRDKALEMFNERGIEYVGLRELAAILDMRVSNITYYFPTKDDLVYELSQELAKRNSEVIIGKEDLTMQGFLNMLHRVFYHHVDFRCLLLSVVHLMKQNKHIAAEYKKTQKVRNSTIRSNLQTLVEGGYLQIKDPEALPYLVSGISLISRFWISESAVSFKQVNTENHIKHYLTLITQLLQPYATSKGKKEIQHFLETIA